MLLEIAMSTALLVQQDQFAPARQGQVLCIFPNPSRKTCTSLTSFTWAGSSQGHTDISTGSGAIYYRSRVAVTYSGNRFCTDKAAYVQGIYSATLFDGRPITGSLLNDFRRNTSQSWGTGVECTDILGVIDGVLQLSQTEPDGETWDMEARWVRPSDGWRVLI
jgi:hypothetical protein